MNSLEVLTIQNKCMYCRLDSTERICLMCDDTYTRMNALLGYHKYYIVIIGRLHTIGDITHDNCTTLTKLLSELNLVYAEYTNRIFMSLLHTRLVHGSDITVWLVKAKNTTWEEEIEPGCVLAQELVVLLGDTNIHFVPYKDTWPDLELCLIFARDIKDIGVIRTHIRRAIDPKPRASKMARVDKVRFTELIARHLTTTSNGVLLDVDLYADVSILVKTLDKTWSPFKALMAVVMAKVVYPDWDTRNHQKQLGGMFSLRTIDHVVISNELHRLGYYDTDVSYAMTRAFERVEPFSESYSGILHPKDAKVPFLRICKRVNDAFDATECDMILGCLFDKLKERKAALDVMMDCDVSMEKPAMSLYTFLDRLDALCKLGTGASVVPELIIQSCCASCYPTLTMKELKHHRTPDKTSKSHCDIEGYNEDGMCVLAIEVKCNIAIADSMVTTFDKKTKDIASRYILSTKTNTKCRVSQHNIMINTVNDFCASELMRVHADILQDMNNALQKMIVESPCLTVSLKQQCIDIMKAG